MKTYKNNCRSAPAGKLPVAPEWKLALATLAIWLTMAPSAYGIVLSHPGFDQIVTPGEPMFGINTDGVARMRPADVEFRCTAALISDTHVLTAAHCFDTDADGIFNDAPEREFEVVFELAEEIVSYSFTNDQVRVPLDWQETNSDLAMIQLDQAVSDQVPRYSLYSGRRELGQEITLIGYGTTGLGESGGVSLLGFKIAGKNRYETTGDVVDVGWMPHISLVYDFDSGREEHNALSLMGLESDLGLGRSEALASLGDSGGPVFLGDRIVGVPSIGRYGGPGDTHPEVSSFGELMRDTRVSSFREFLETATDGQATFTSVIGDFDTSGSFDPPDIDLLTLATREGSNDAYFDLDLSGNVDGADRMFWVEHLVGTYFGDANLDGLFDPLDIVEVLSANQYDDGIPLNSTWSTGDWNGDGDFGPDDLVFVLQRDSFGQGPRLTARALPEPSSMMLLATGLITVSRIRPLRRHLEKKRLILTS